MPDRRRYAKISIPRPLKEIIEEFAAHKKYTPDELSDFLYELLVASDAALVKQIEQENGMKPNWLMTYQPGKDNSEQ